MDQIIIDKIVGLYELYGFELSKKYKDKLIFTFSNGYFLNCEIMCFSNSDNSSELNGIKDNYEKIGYSVRIINSNSLEDIEKKLYSGFFKISMSREKRKAEYDRFVEMQNTRLYGGESKYSYIDSKYIYDSNSYDNSIIDELYKIFQKERSQLIIVEAAAGYGKTCTSYEIMKRIVEDESDTVPLFIELSKNRSARVFRHVLLDAIDTNFSYLSSDVVKYAIQKGKVPLVIDGFDELLSKSINDDNKEIVNADEKTDAQNMLSTIAELLEEDSKAKILLTSRKSSMFVGELFDEWVLDNLQYCDVSRFTIEEPTLVNWIGKDKEKFINEKNIPFHNISNPIILSIYRNMDLDEFKQKCDSTEHVLEGYFQNIMKREKQRQSLNLDVEEQYDIFVKLASYMVQYDFSSEEQGIIKEILSEILIDKIKDYLKRYEDSNFNYERPNEDEFIQKLLCHAVLDRKSQVNHMLGFINDFVFGIFIGDAIISKELPVAKLGIKYLELASTSFAVRSIEKKQALYELVSSFIMKMGITERLIIEMNLINKTNNDYNEGLVSGLVFNRSFYFSNNSKFNKVCFSRCIFKGHTILDTIFKDCQFVECKFYDCEIINSNGQDSMQFIACEGVESYSSVVENQSCDDRNYEKIVLEQYWRTGRGNADPKHTYRTLLKGMNTSEYGHVDEAIKKLKNLNLLYNKGEYLVLNIKEINKIKEIIGR